MNKELFGSCFCKGVLRMNSKTTAQALAHISQNYATKQNYTNKMKQIECFNEQAQSPWSVQKMLVIFKKRFKVKFNFHLPTSFCILRCTIKIIHLKPALQNCQIPAFLKIALAWSS